MSGLYFLLFWSDAVRPVGIRRWPPQAVAKAARRFGVRMGEQNLPAGSDEVRVEESMG